MSHDPFAAHRNIRIELQAHRFRPLPGKPVESPHLVRAVLDAVTCSDAAIVDLVVDAFF